MDNFNKPPLNTTNSLPTTTTNAYNTSQSITSSPAPISKATFVSEDSDELALDVQEIQSSNTVISSTQVKPASHNVRKKMILTGTIPSVVVLIIIILLIGWRLLASPDNSGSAPITAQPSSSVDLSGFQLSIEKLTDADKLVVNGTIVAYQGLVLGVQTQPANPQTGQVYYDQTLNVIRFYNGTEFKSLLTSDNQTSEVTNGDATGATGPAGPAGANGAPGATGAQGPAGPSGVASCPNGPCLSLQPTAPGVVETGNINVSGDVNLGGSLLARNTVDSTTAFQVQNASGTTNLLNIDSTNSIITVDATMVLAANQSLTITGGNTASRPGSPTEGMVYFDTTTDSLITYANGKWQSDRGEFIVVAASDSTQAEKDSADYVADGTADQTEINSALTEAAGGKVILLAGTYVADATILIPNNTTLAGSGPGTVIELADIDVFDNLIENLDTTTGTGVVIRDLKLDGRKDLNTVGNQRGIVLNGIGDFASGTAGATIENIEVTRFMRYGIITFQSDNNSISNSRMTENGATGIFLGDSSINNLVKGNVIDSNNEGIYVEWNSHGNTVTDNKISSVTNMGIGVEQSNRTVVSNNTITDAPADAGIYVYDSATITITGNIIENTMYGVFFDGTSVNSGLITVSNNVIKGSSDNGIYVYGVAGINFTGNTIENSGGATDNNGIFLDDSDNNNITDNIIKDDSCTTTCYAINISSYGSSDKNYLSGNRYTGSVANTASIFDAGTNTIYNNQQVNATTSTNSDVSEMRLRGSANSTTAFAVQNASGVSVLNIDTTNGEVELGTSAVAGKLVVSDGSSNTGTILVASTAGDYTYTIPTTTANDTFCLLSLNNCGAGPSGFIQNGNSFGATAVLGTNDSNSLILETANTTALTIDTSQNSTFAGNLVVSATKSLTLAGGNTASRPGSPTEGMVYFDSTTDSLITYANSKWQSDRGEFIVVAASDSTQAEKDSADYVADGTADQTEINSALTEAAGGKVILLPGTYVANATILIPNNTTLAGSGPGTVIELADLDVSENLIENSDTTTGTGVVVRDLKINGRSDLNTAGLQNGIYFNNVGSSTLAGGLIENATVVNFRNRGIYLNNSLNSMVNNNYAKNVYQPYVIFYSDGAVLSNNTGEDSTGGGILVYGDQVKIVNNTIRNASNRSIDLDIYDSLVSGNTIDGSLCYGMFLDGDGNIITDNTITDSGCEAILVFSNNNTISNNRLTNAGGLTTNNALYLSSNSDNNLITDNTITDTSCTTDCYAIIIDWTTEDNNYLADNSLGNGTIQDLGTGTVYGGQTLSATSQFRFRGSNSTTAFAVQNASGASILTVDTTNGELEVGNTTTAGRLVVSDGSSNTATILVASTSGDYTYTIPTTTANDTFCLLSLNNCGAGPSGFIQNGNSFAATAVLGTNDSNSLILETANTTALTIDTSQNATFAGNLVVSASKSLTLTGGNTASRPASPTEGMVYFDSTTDSLLTYANGKWQSDRGEFIVVAASDSTQAEKDSADYVADGTTDQTEINSALTEAAGGKVILLAGTYVANATILIPNNTTLAGSGLGTVIELNVGATSDNLIENSDTTTGTGVVIRDMKLDGRRDLNTGFPQSGIYLTGIGSGVGGSATKGANLTGLAIEDFLSNGVRISGSDNNIISNNFIQNDNTATALYFFNSANNTIVGNRFQGNYNGIYVQDNFNNNTISSNTFESNGLGISMYGSSNNTISSNTLTTNEDFGIRFDTNSNNNIVDGNAIDGALYYGIDTWQSSNNIFSNNIIRNAGDSAMFLTSSSNNNIISGNRITDSGGTTGNNGIMLDYSSYPDYNQIINNTVADSSCTTTCYAINISNAGSNKNYLEGNRFTGSTANAASINDAGTGTIYAGQQTNTTTSTNSDVSDFRFRGSANSTTAFAVQNASGASILTVDTTNGELEVGNTTTAGRLVISDGSSNTATILVQSTAGDYTYTIPTTTANDTFCLATLGNCFGAGSGGTLQAAYNAGNTITTTDARDIDFTLANTTTDSNFDIVVASGSTSAFRIYNDATLAVSYTTANGFSVPGGTNSERFGSGASAVGIGSLAVGRLASAVGTDSVVLGYNATSSVVSSSGDLVVIGANASASDGTSVAVGQGSTVSRFGTAVGDSANASSGIALGRSTIAGGSIAIGNSSNAGGSSQGIALGENSSTSAGGGPIAIGYSADSSAQRSIAIGYDSNVNNRDSIAIGFQSTANNIEATALGTTAKADYLSSIALGAYAVTTAANQLVIGSSGASINQGYFGNGVTNATPGAFTLNATGGSGTDIAGANFTLAGGRGTGSANGGSILFQTSAAGASATTLRNLSTVLTLAGGTGAATFQNVANSSAGFRVLNAAGTNTLLNVDTSASAVSIANSAVASTVTIGNTTGATGVSVLAGSGNINIGNAGVNNTIQIGAANNINTNQNINIGNNAAGTSSSSVTIGSSEGASAVTINAGGSGAINIGNNYNIGNNTIQIGVNTANGINSGQTIGIGNNEAGTAQTTTINLGSSRSGSVTNILAGSGGVNVLTGALTLGTSSQAGTLRVSDGSLNFATINVSALAGNYTVSIPTITANDTFCLVSGNCSGVGGLQASYNAGNTITTTNARDIDFTLADTATDSNFDIVVASGSTSAFRIYNNATLAVSYTTANGFSVPGSGILSEQFGYGAVAGSARSVALGYGASTTGTGTEGGVAIGYNAAALHRFATAIGYNVQAPDLSVVIAGTGVTSTNAVVIGYGATSVGGNGALAIGSNANATSTGTAIGGQGSSATTSSIAVGWNAQSTGGASVALGDRSTASGSAAIALGQQASSTATGALALGNFASASFIDSIALGAYATTTANDQLVLGSNNRPISQAYLGSGVADPTPSAFTLNATGGSGTDIVGANLSLAGGRGTGSANGGSLLFQTSAAGASGVTLRNLSTVLTLAGGTGVATFQNTTDSTAGFQVKEAGGTNLFTVDTTNEIIVVNRATDGTLIDLQVAGASQGTITVAAGVVSYNAFTGSHYGLFDGTSASTGQLVDLTGNNQYRTGSNEPIYGITKTNIANSPDVLGAYLATQNPLIGASLNNPELIMAAGNGEIWIADNGSGNVRIGDPLISSGDVAGHAMRDNKAYAVSHIFAKSAENIDWSTISTQVNGIKVAKVSVLFSYYNQDNLTTNLQTQGIEVTGIALFGGDVSIGASLNVSGSTTLTNLTVTGITQLASLKVTGLTEVADFKVNGKIITAGITPTAVLGTTTTGQGSTYTIEGNDTAGTITLITGTNTTSNPLTAGEQITVTFNVPFTATPRVTLTPTSAASANIHYYVLQTETEFKLVFTEIPAELTEFSFNYQILQ